MKTAPFGKGANFGRTQFSKSSTLFSCPPNCHFKKTGVLSRKTSIRTGHRYSLCVRSCLRDNSGRKDVIDVVGLANLCVDAVVQVDELPSRDVRSEVGFIEELLANPPPESTWEVGGACNFMIAGSRLGLNVASIGHCGGDVYGDFLVRVLREEGVGPIEKMHNRDTIDSKGNGNGSSHPLLSSTLICFVLVDGDHNHAFCSQYDMQVGPIFGDEFELPESAVDMLKSARGLFINGFIFDECSPGFVLKVAKMFKDEGGVIFLDPGPRCFPIMKGERRGREVLEELVEMADVVLMTEEEARMVTGENSPHACANWVLSRPGSQTQWCVVKLGRKGSLIQTRAQNSPLVSEGFCVQVADTVGCGDSFASAIALGFLDKGANIRGVQKLANAVGAATATGIGAGRNVASPDKVIELLGNPPNEDGDINSAMEILGRSLGGHTNLHALR